MAAARWSVHEVTGARWADLERLFEARGGPKYCWCMAWREVGDAKSRKAALHARVDEGTPIGLLGYEGDEPVAWCSVAPRASHRRLVSDGSADDGVWSITCFYVIPRLRRDGVMAKLIDAAVRLARSRGARLVEAYPVTADSPSYRFMGFVPAFERQRFVETGTEGKRRHVMQRRLRAKRA